MVEQNSNRILGQQGEDIAVHYLESQGYLILERNFKYNRCEIDIITRQNDTLVFVEVKAGKSSRYGSPELRVDRKKEKQIATAAEGFLCQYAEDDFDCRFDVISVTWDYGQPRIEHIEEAFWLEEES